MTCIVGFTDKKNKCIWMGCDSLGSNGHTKSIEGQAKAFHHYLFDNIIMGSTSTFRHIDLLKYSETLFPEIDKYKKTEIDHKYMVKIFIPNLVNLFQGSIYSENTENRGANFLLGVDDKLFEIQEDYSVLQPQDGFSAVGCGGYIAMGSLITTTHYFSNLNPEDHIKFALEAAENASCGVQRPFRIINTKDDKEIIIT